jgi:hypothetical protein
MVNYDLLFNAVSGRRRLNDTRPTRCSRSAIDAVGWHAAAGHMTAQTLLQMLPPWAQLALLIVPAASAIFAAVGLLLTVYQSRRTNEGDC